MAKSMRSKRKRRLRTLRREIAEPFYDKKEEAKLAAQEAALAAPKLEIPVRRYQMGIGNLQEGGPRTTLLWQRLPSQLIQRGMHVADAHAIKLQIEPASGGGNERAPMAIDSGDMKKSVLKPVGGIQKQRKNKSGAKRQRTKRRKNKKQDF